MSTATNQELVYVDQKKVSKIHEKVLSLDLEPIIVKLMDSKEGLGWSLEKCLEVQKIYQEFMTLNLVYTEHELVPIHNVDLFWHQHALDTEKYRSDCQIINSNVLQQIVTNFLNWVFQFFGLTIMSGFIDHFPYFGMRGEADLKNLEEGYAISNLISIHHFDRSISGKNYVKCGPISCHYCKTKSWTDRPTLASVM
jgi:hypothetical protein